MLTTFLLPTLLHLSAGLGPGSDPAPSAALPELASLAAPTERLIAAVPPGAFAVGYCASLPHLRTSAAENSWYRILRSEAGQAWREVGRDALRQAAQGVGRGDELVRDLWDRLPGGAVLFAGPSGGGLVLEIAGVEADVEELLNALLAEPRRDWQRAEREHQGLALECLAPAGALWQPSSQAADPSDPEDRESLAAVGAEPGAIVLGRGRGHLFFLGGERAPEVLALAQASIDGWHAGRSAAGDRFRGARAAIGGGGLELFVDLSPFADDARSRFAAAASDLDVDPVTLLGLEGETWVYGTLELFRGDRIDARGRLAIPRGGIAARTLATLKTLPADLLARVPAQATSVAALGWDVGAFFGLVREVARELAPEGTGPTLDNALEAAKASLGVDFEQDVVAQLSGLFLSYTHPTEAAGGGVPIEELMESVWLVGLRDGARFQNALEQLLELTGVLDELTLIDIEGSDVYYFAETGWDVGPRVSPGFACAPDALLFSPRHGLLEGALKTLSRAEGAPSLVEVPRFRAAYDENLGAVAFGALELGALHPYLMQGGVRAPQRAAGAPSDEDAEPSDPFGRLLVWSLRPSAAGLDLRLGTR